ncbi:MAG: hypothetical protein QW255_04455 [Candidatus Bilamarchaeaceae archaeon]
MRANNIHPLAEQIIKKALQSDKRLVNTLKLGSVSPRVAQHRLEQYAKALSNSLRSMDSWRMFSTSNLPGLGVVLGVSSLLAMVTSFAGFLAIERTIEQPRIVQYFADVIGTNFDISGNPSTKFPVVGPTDYSDDNVAMIRVSQGGASPYTVPSTLIPYPVIPGTVKITVTLTPTTPGTPIQFVVTDDRQGNLLIPGGYANYFDLTNNPTISYGTFNPLTPASINNLTIQATGFNVNVLVEANRAFIEEPTMPTAGNDTRLQLSLSRTVMVDTKPSLLTVQLNLSEIALAKKSMNMDIPSFLTQKISEVYSKVVNRYIVQTFTRSLYNPSNTVTIDLYSPIPVGPPPATQWYQFTPILDKLVAQMEEVNNRLAMQSYIGLKATAYLVSPRLAYWIRRTRILDPSAFVEENVSYINELIGYWYGVPVLVHTDLASIFDGADSRDTANLVTCGGFAVHLRPDASLAPVFHAIFLPPTNTPNVGNYFNPVQQAMSLYYQVDTVPLAPELVVPFRVIGLPNA